MAFNCRYRGECGCPFAGDPLINENFAGHDHLELMEKVQSQFADLDSTTPYYDAFESQLSFLQYQKGKDRNSDFSIPRWSWILLIIPIGMLWYFWRLRGTSENRGNTPGHKINSLSNQERRVFSLLRKGKSNKEISSELHIEVSTVKSHLNKIYSRLGVKSRRDIIDKEL